MEEERSRTSEDKREETRNEREKGKKRRTHMTEPN